MCPWDLGSSWISKSVCECHPGLSSRSDNSCLANLAERLWEKEERVLGSVDMHHALTCTYKCQSLKYWNLTGLLCWCLCQRAYILPSHQNHLHVEMLICSLWWSDHWAYHNDVSLCSCAREIKKVSCVQWRNSGVERIHKSTSVLILQANIWDSGGRQWAAGVWAGVGEGILAPLALLCQGWLNLCLLMPHPSHSTWDQPPWCTDGHPDSLSPLQTP